MLTGEREPSPPPRARNQACITEAAIDDLCVAGPAMRQLDALPSKVAAAVVEFMLGPLLDEPH